MTENHRVQVQSFEKGLILPIFFFFFFFFFFCFVFLINKFVLIFLDIVVFFFLLFCKGFFFHLKMY